MANNRLWAVCKDDNHCIPLLKNYSDWYCIGNEDDHNAFFAAHEHCKSNHGMGENIVFVTEIEDARVILYNFAERPMKIYLVGDEQKPEYILYKNRTSSIMPHLVPNKEE